MLEFVLVIFLFTELFVCFVQSADTDTFPHQNLILFFSRRF